MEGIGRRLSLYSSTSARPSAAAGRGRCHRDELRRLRPFLAALLERLGTGG